MRKVASVGIDPQELELAKQQTSAAILLGLEDSAARAAALAQSEMMYGRYISADETLSAVQAVTAEQIQAIARKYFKTKRVAFAALGDLNGLRVRRGDLNI
jgi:predicted Zn-dependent peptidase